MHENISFLEAYAKDGGLLQSEAWRTFQLASGRSVKLLFGKGYLASAVTHELSIVGKYLYVPRGPIVRASREEYHECFRGLISEGKRQGARWIRVEPASDGFLEHIRQHESVKGLWKSPHDMQPREVLAIDITGEREALLASMKQKTRYNIRLAEKKEVRVFSTQEETYQDIFIRLIGVTARRKGITPHDEKYYRTFFETFPKDSWELVVAMREHTVLAVNIMVYFGKWAYYLHGGTADHDREAMAPYLLQWRSIEIAKMRGCHFYDFGGVSIRVPQRNLAWEGITRFKQGFAPDTETIVFPGAYDIILSRRWYALYNTLRLLKKSFMTFGRLF
jgi:lipid II:glycine glycyltransferase (peptidoglycan interpeptide bridge formation enzyme)